MSIRSILSHLNGLLSNFLTPLARRNKSWETDEYVEVFPALRSIPVSAPVNRHMLDETFSRQFVNEKSIPLRRIFRLKDVYVHGHAIVFRNMKLFMPSLPWRNDFEKYATGRNLSRQWIAERIKVPAGRRTALVYDIWSSDNYYHWMIESLPRLLLVRCHSSEATIIVPVPAPEFVRTTVEMLGFRNIIELNKNKSAVVYAEELLFPELVYYYEDPDELKDGKVEDSQLFSHIPHGLFEHAREELVGVVRRLILKQFPADVKPHRQVYVSRSSQRARRLLNEEEILPLLSRLNIEVVRFESMSFHQQVSLAMETKVFIGVHGANMVNVMFLPQSSIVIELMNESHVNDAYYLLCSSLSIPYYVVPCKMHLQPDASAIDSVAKNDADLVVDITMFEMVLQEVARNSVFQNEEALKS